MSEGRVIVRVRMMMRSQVWLRVRVESEVEGEEG